MRIVFVMMAVSFALLGILMVIIQDGDDRRAGFQLCLGAALFLAGLSAERLFHYIDERPHTPWTPSDYL